MSDKDILAGFILAGLLGIWLWVLVQAFIDAKFGRE